MKRDIKTVINVVEYALIQFDPTVSVFCAQVVTDDGQHSGSEWRETYGSKVEAEAFVRGAKSILAAYGVLMPTIIWKKIELAPVKVKPVGENDY